jgi:hypothetical protein
MWMATPTPTGTNLHQNKTKPNPKIQEMAQEESQKYKEGKVILERVSVVASHSAIGDHPAFAASICDDSSDECC